MKVQFPLPQVSAQRDCICETITLSQSKEAAFKWSVKVLGGANNHSSLSHCVTEVLNPPFVLHITCLSIDCLVLHLRHLDGHAFKRGPGALRVCELCVDIQQLAFPNHPLLFFFLFSPSRAQNWICWMNLYYCSWSFYVPLLSCLFLLFSFWLRGPEVSCNPGSSQLPKGDNTLPNL